MWMNNKIVLPFEFGLLSPKIASIVYMCWLLAWLCWLGTDALFSPPVADAWRSKIGPAPDDEGDIPADVIAIDPFIGDSESATVTFCFNQRDIQYFLVFLRILFEIDLLVQPLKKNYLDVV